MRRIDELHLQLSFSGARKLTREVQWQGFAHEVLQLLQRTPFSSIPRVPNAGRRVFRSTRGLDVDRSLNHDHASESPGASAPAAGDFIVNPSEGFSWWTPVGLDQRAP